MRIALYARVSTGRQQQTHTIEQQLTRLRNYVTTQPDWSLAPEHIFCDDGFSGAKLKRPGLDHLRDQAALGAFDLVLLTAPDRLARNYVHQMLLLEELERAHCPVQFLDRPVSDDPHDQLVLQIRGAVAEYERTLIIDRMRRGRQTKLRTGELLPWTRTPYGYRAHPERPRDAALLQIDPAQAAIVQELFEAYGSGGVSIYQLAQRLSKRQVPSPAGTAHWSQTTVRLLLLNPCYTGTAYANRIHTRPTARRKSPLQPIGKGESGFFSPPEEWLPIPVPAIVSQAVFDRAQARLATNQRMAQRSTRYNYLLRGLVSCGHCRLQCHGQFRPPHYYYYLCNGRLEVMQSRRTEPCTSRYIPAERLEALVWNDLCEVLRQPELISMVLERAHSGAWLPEELQQRQATIQQALSSLQRQRERLLAAYLAEAIELAEFERRQRELVHQQGDLQNQARELAHYSEQLLVVREAIPTIQAICERLQMGLEQATFEQKRQLLELLVDCVIVTDGDVEIRYVIPTTEASTHIRFCHLRKDYFGRLRWIQVQGGDDLAVGAAALHLRGQPARLLVGSDDALGVGQRPALVRLQQLDHQLRRLAGSQRPQLREDHRRVPGLAKHPHLARARHRRAEGPRPHPFRPRARQLAARRHAHLPSPLRSSVPNTSYKHPMPDTVTER
ncbi:MAG TPA: recombinase family protein [Chloroflexaceae bacterium]|nr:recombinase family protein [Chloroflexaceae bacterium]